MCKYFYNTVYFNSMKEVNLPGTNHDEMCKKMTGDIYKVIANYNNHSSGWIFKKVISLDIHMDEFRPLRGSSYIDLTRIPS